MNRSEQVKRKLKGARDLYDIVKTMKVLAAVSIHNYEEAVDSLVQYFDTIEMGLQIVLNHHPRLAGSLQVSKQRPLQAVFVFGSGQPMCGQFNDQLASYVTGRLETRPDKLVVSGQRMVGTLERAGWQTDTMIEVPTSLSTLNQTVQNVVLQLDEWYSHEGYRSVVLYYNKSLPGSGYNPVSQQILPVDADWIKRLSRNTWESRSLPIYHMDPETLFSELIRQYLFFSVYRAFAESLASENSSRLEAMQVAERKIEDRIHSLNKRYSQHRQDEITEEILDITAGFEAIVSDL